MSGRLLRHALSSPSVALEETSDGKLNKEIEQVFYGKLENFDQLSGAAGCEYHEQWEIKLARNERNGGSGKIRVRKTTFEDDRIEYVLTTKVRMSGDNAGASANNEVSIPSTEAQFEQFKVLAESGMRKTRFLFPVPNSDLVWEVDVFSTGLKAIQPELRYRPWVKLDLELDNPNQEVPPLPMEFAEVIGQESTRDERQNEIVDWLYENEFLTPNPYRNRGMDA